MELKRIINKHDVISVLTLTAAPSEGDQCLVHLRDENGDLMPGCKILYLNRFLARRL